MSQTKAASILARLKQLHSNLINSRQKDKKQFKLEFK